ncbi:cytochrome c-type biogenesis protein CcmF [Palleronia marisminoris]|uniref:Cytochrome c-type biogenesis protein CcmF n=1 Tax=Palleronia marisminoris TaxID=315423 RepID=A0A1Y5RLC0_9RHOB|nr:heme lyase CcmF/NrfE family subunit [Palleronia marisminoris]SFG19668.1 cytochrome c-type biogenesis protein CcmF [Palleronia marisminoris]SLN17241.1 Cytochrome c-type biogenesis protein CcmF [Palleronia marisminoris]
MIIELGHFALILGFVMAVLQCALPLVGAQKGWRGFMAAGEPAAQAQFLFLLFAFGAITWGFVSSDFSLRLVTMNSHTAKPMLYKITGVWGNHEGSMLLWCLILAFYAALAAWFGGNLTETLRARVIGVQGAISVAFLGFLIFTSNPFWRLEMPPLNGEDLNPLLQDPGLAFHPPFLYLGYVGLSMAFSFAVAALIEGRVDAAWGRWVRPWTLVAWVFLTIGIALGSWWAYYELGWGGFWFWDPVENASFMPWLIAAALLHSAIVVEKREALKSWTILLAILAFGFSLIGAFIVRSGVLTSVHAFANDPERGVYLLAITGVFMGGALTLYAARASALEAKGIFSLTSRETALVANNVLLAVAAFVVFVGTVWPLVAEMAFDRKLSVGAPFFNAAFTPFMVALALLLPIGTLMPWKRARMGRVMGQLWGIMALSIALGGLVWVMRTGGSMLAPIGAVLAAWLVLGTLVDLKTRAGRGDLSSRARRLGKLPRADWGRAVAHAGFGITIFGVAALTAWQVEDIRVAQVGETFTVAPYEITLASVEESQGPNYATTMARMEVTRNGDPVATLYPEKRLYPVARMPTTEAAIDNGILRDLYLVIGDPQNNGGWAVRTYIKPFANWIWAGAIIMAIGGGLSLSDRRHRVAAGAAKAHRTKAVPAE